MRILQSDRIKQLNRIKSLNLPKKTEAIVICETGDSTTKAITDAVADKREQLVCGYVDKTFVAIGNSAAGFNADYCRGNGITVLHSPNPVMGGAVIFSAGDLTFSYITKDLNSDWIGAAQKGICDYLTKKGFTAAIDKNDVLIDGKKISGSSSGTQGGMRVESMFIAVVSSAELVEKICLKKSGKKPTALQEYNINAKEVQDAVIGLTKRYMSASECKKRKNRKENESAKPRGKRTLRDVLGGGDAGASMDAMRKFQDKLRAHKTERGK